MRPLEILTPLVLAVYILFPLTGKKRPPAVGILPAFVLIIIATHARIEGMRWQMIPLYAITIMALLFSIPAFFRSVHADVPTKQPSRVALNLILLSLSTALPALLPVPAIPIPSGPYQVGTRIFELTDPSRKELYSGVDESRRFQIQVWYPSEPNESNDRARWMSQAEIFTTAISQDILHLPAFFLDHLTLVKIPTYVNVDISAAGAPYPIILFSHGWNGFNAQNTGQALELASHGYVVVGVQHTYGAVITVFDDGTIAKNNPDALPDGLPDDEYDTAANKLADQWASDLAYALDFLENENMTIDGPLYNSLDTSRVGVYGHSMGGGAAIQFCGVDTRCKALLGLDPYMIPVWKDILEEGIAQPSFYMFSQDWTDRTGSRNNNLFGSYNKALSNSYGAVYIEGTGHYDFSDLPLLTPLASQLGLKGPINGKRVTTIIKDHLVTFFDASLKNYPTDLFTNGKYPEVVIRNQE